MSGKLNVWLYALGAYALALIGALGLAWLLRLDLRGALLLVGVVALIALFGTLIPLLRLGYTRLADEQGRAAGNSPQEKEQ